MPFNLTFTDEASSVLDQLRTIPQYHKKYKKVRKALGQLELNPRHPGLQTHKYESHKGPNGEPLFEAYVENNTPSAWRIFFSHGPDDSQITVLTIGPHP